MDFAAPGRTSTISQEDLVGQVTCSLMLIVQRIWNRLLPSPDSDSASRETTTDNRSNSCQTTTDYHADKSGQQVVTPIVTPLASGVLVEEAVLEIHNVDGMFSLRCDPFLEVVPHATPRSTNPLDLCKQPSHVRGVGQSVVEGMDHTKSFHDDKRDCAERLDNTSAKSTQT